MLTPDGFPGERLRVLPRPLVSRLLTSGATQHMLVTDAGHFPHAVSHGRVRRQGASGTIVIVCVDGLGWCELGDRVVAVPSGSALVIPPETPHLYRADAATPWTIWWLHAAGTDIPVLLEAIHAGLNDPVVEIGDLFRVTSMLEHVVDCLERDETMPSLLEAAGTAWALFAQLAADRASGGRRRHEPIRDAQDHLRENFSAPVCVPELARLAGLSTSHFSTLFRAATGGGVIEYVKSLRMAHARELLVTTSRTMAEIAESVGYADAFYFSRQFRAINGCSPTQYRAQKHGESVGP